MLSKERKIHSRNAQGTSRTVLGRLLRAQLHCTIKTKKTVKKLKEAIQTTLTSWQ